MSKTTLETMREGITPWAMAAKNIKRELAAEFPGIKFSVRSEAYSMGDSVNIYWELGATSKEVEAVTNKYVTSSFDGMQDLKTCFSTPFTDKHGGADHVSTSRHIPESIYEQVQRDLCTLQHVEYKGQYTKLFENMPNNYDLGSEAHQVLCRCGFRAGETYAGVEFRPAGDNQAHWCRIVKQGAAIQPAIPSPDQPVKSAPDMVKTTHTQKGYDLFVVRLGARVSRAQFSAYLNEAREFGGWWSGYDKDGAIPGFQFKTEIKAQAFLHVLGGKPSLEAAQATNRAESVAVETVKAINVAEKFRAWAEAMTAKIEDKRRPMTQNPTPKRNCQYRSRLHDSDNMERTQQALLALAVAHDAGTVPPVLASIKTKSQIEPLVYKGLDGGGYYDVIPSRDYRDKSPAGLALQAMIDKPGVNDNKRKISLLEQKISLSNIPSFFPTPPELVQRMIDFVKPEAGEIVLEPSAGSGAIACAINHGAKVEALEVNYTLRELLTLKGVNLVGSDFMEFQPARSYDGVIMNPPFERGQDVEHIRKAFDCLKDGGRMAAICSPGFTFRDDAKFSAFRDWIGEVAADVEDIPAGAFAKSGTGVAAKMILIQK